MSEKPASHWTFLTNHAHVLFCLSQNSDQTLREVARQVGITERAVQRIVTDLESGGVIYREREGRRNRYVIDKSSSLRHPLEQHCNIGDLLQLLAQPVSTLD